MFIYEVNLTVEEAVATEYSTWLREHIREMLKLDGFEAAAWYIRSDDTDELPDGDDPVDPRQWTIHYQVDSRAHLQSYFDTHAARMRSQGERFSDHVTADRRVLEQRRTFSQHNPDSSAPGR
jgi:hypothetical protein